MCFITRIIEFRMKRFYGSPYLSPRPATGVSYAPMEIPTRFGRTLIRDTTIRFMKKKKKNVKIPISRLLRPCRPWSFIRDFVNARAPRPVPCRHRNASGSDACERVIITVYDAGENRAIGDKKQFSYCRRIYETRQYAQLRLTYDNFKRTRIDLVRTNERTNDYD